MIKNSLFKMVFRSLLDSNYITHQPVRNCHFDYLSNMHLLAVGFLSKHVWQFSIPAGKTFG